MYLKNESSANFYTICTLLSDTVYLAGDEFYDGLDETINKRIT